MSKGQRAKGKANAGKAPLSAGARRQLARLVDAKGQPEVARILGVGQGTIARALGGLDLRAGTALLISTKLPPEREEVGA